MSSITQHVASEIFEDMQSAMVLLLFQVQLLLVAFRIFAPSSVPRRLGSVRMPCEPSQLTREAREDYGEELRKAICYVNGGGAIATASGGTLLVKKPRGRSSVR